MRTLAMTTLDDLPDGLWMRLSDADQERVVTAYANRAEYVHLSNMALLCKRRHPLEEYGEVIGEDDIRCKECVRLKEERKARRCG